MIAAEDQKYIDKLVAFAITGFPERKFTEDLYRWLSRHFDHIAHYDRGGFYGEWFSSLEKQIRWLNLACWDWQASRHDHVEAEVKRLLVQNGIRERLFAAHTRSVEQAERAELRRLATKYPDELKP